MKSWRLFFFDDCFPRREFSCVWQNVVLSRSPGVSCFRPFVFADRVFAGIPDQVWLSIGYYSRHRIIKRYLVSCGGCSTVFSVGGRAYDTLTTAFFCFSVSSFFGGSLLALAERKVLTSARRHLNQVYCLAYHKRNQSNRVELVFYCLLISFMWVLVWIVAHQ